MAKVRERRYSSGVEEAGGVREEEGKMGYEL